MLGSRVGGRVNASGALESASTFAIPISSGIFAHCQKIGIAIWVFIWMIDRTTREVATEEGCAEGLVYGGKPIGARKIAQDLGMATRTVHAHIEQLIAAGYLRRIDYGEGLPSGYSVGRSKKWKHKLLLTLGEEPPLTPLNSAHPRRKTAGGSLNSALPSPNSALPSLNPAPYIEDITRTLQGLLLGMPSVPSDPSDDGGVPKSLTEDERLADAWAYYREKLNRSSTYAFTKKRRSMGEQGLRACRKLALEMGSVSPEEDAIKFLKLAIDRLTKEPYHNGANDQGTKYLDWEHLFRGKDKPCPQKLTEYWLDSARRWAQ
jgi:hypothetical protein